MQHKYLGLSIQSTYGLLLLRLFAHLLALLYTSTSSSHLAHFLERFNQIQRFDKRIL
jgi:hypothetical protein